MLAKVFGQHSQGRNMKSESSEIFTAKSSKGRRIYEDSKFGCLKIKLSFLYFGRRDVCYGLEQVSKLRTKSAFMRAMW